MTSNMSIEEVRAVCLKSYAALCELLQEDGWFDSVHRELCDWLQGHIESDYAAGRITERNVTMPRGSLKTTIVTKYLPIWIAIQPPEKFGLSGSDTRTLLASNTHTNACKKLSDIRGVFDSHPLFKAAFPQLLPTRNCTWTDQAAEVSRVANWPESTFEACGLKTKKVGSHYNMIIEDDTVAPGGDDSRIDVTAPTVDEIEKGIGWHQAAYMLLVPKGLRIRIVVTTRWAEEDLVNYIRDNEAYGVFDYPAFDVHGNCVFSQFYTHDELDVIQKRIGPYMFSCLYLNKPLDASKRTFKKDWFHYIHRSEMPKHGYYTISVDPAISDKNTACETAITVIKHVADKDDYARSETWYLTDTVHGFMEPTKIAMTCLDFCQSLDAPVKRIIIESNAYQDSLKYTFRDEMRTRDMMIGISMIPSKKNKLMKIEALQPLFYRGQLIFIRGISNQIESQLTQFPNGKLVDLIDSLSMHLELYRGQKKRELYKPKKEVDEFEQAVQEIRKRHEEAFVYLQNSDTYDPFGEMDLAVEPTRIGVN